ncbi:pyridoxamine 5'-phosphate oxidase family protein [Fictibacillus phosphorivorans]|uniref:pyridoxamine 5'-phosphate oxidase family protein n=1 Tax=Fictibacillus phosphorivorans TaxID=1221500 RepID=UPI00203A7310|nr:pyridoxamine 5'-phosphate oxidase family protein [Fictibacillus phosphorivorans]MCM3718049.1 pyridoxamine 5'-phosphate oxidase family protein [Fictibacillus phosphorivorans]MCM3775676.1 pyridoxamine 5'-phosphate oxidase family protein [Fictibacillus phosphorivorans]
MTILFKKYMANPEELRTMLGSPSIRGQNKVISAIDEHCREFIRKSPFVVLATSDAAGNCDSSPRGDAPGFVYVVDDQHLIIPERPGNKRADSMFNLLENPRVGLLFMIPGMGETLRINGEATIIRDEDILEKMAVNGKPPQLGIVVKVEQCFMHCGKAFKRSGLWEQKKWLAKEEQPNAAKIIADHVNLPGMTEEVVAEALLDGYKNKLY